MHLHLGCPLLGFKLTTHNQPLTLIATELSQIGAHQKVAIYKQFFFRIFLAVSDFFLDFFSGGHLFLVVFRISWRSQNFLAVTFPNFPESAQMRLCLNHSPPLVQG
jgi:hypothetical protein